MIYLIRNFDLEIQNKKNENLVSDIFIDKDLLEKCTEFYGLDNWKKKSIKDLVLFLKTKKNKKNVSLFFKKWNWNVEYIYNELSLNLKEYSFKWNEEIITSLKNKNLLNSYSKFKNLNEEEKFGTLVKLISDYGLFNLLKELNDSFNDLYLSLGQVYHLIILEIFGEK